MLTRPREEGLLKAVKHVEVHKTEEEERQEGHSFHGRRKQLKNSPQIRTLFLFRSRFITKAQDFTEGGERGKGG